MHTQKCCWKLLQQNTGRSLVFDIPQKVQQQSWNKIFKAQNPYYCTTIDRPHTTSIYYSPTVRELNNMDLQKTTLCIKKWIFVASKQVTYDTSSEEQSCVGIPFLKSLGLPTSSS
jgi:hypothetical protein